MNNLKQIIGVDYPCIIRRKRRGFYTVCFTALNGESNIADKYIFLSKYFAEVVRTQGFPREWHINIKNMDGHVVYHATDFFGLIETCKYARYWLMELEGVSNEKETM